MTNNEITLLEALMQAQDEINLLKSYCRNEMSERDQKRLATEMQNRGYALYDARRVEIFRTINYDNIV
jgi:hypothetical protein